MNAEQMLSDTFVRHEYLAPDAAAVLADIHEHLDTRPRRRISTLVAAVAAAVAVAGTAIAATIFLGPAAPPPSDRPTPAYVTTADDRVSQFGVPVGGRFVDRNHGFVVLERCPYSYRTPLAVGDPRYGVPCTDVLEATSDGGKTYHERALPTTRMASIDLYVFDVSHLAIVQQGVTVAFGNHEVNPPAARWISADGGVTWTPVDVQPGAAITEIPAGAQIIRLGNNGDRPAVLTPDGVSHPLTQSVVATAELAADRGTVTAAGGMYFLTSDADPRYPGTNGDLWISRDDGRTWQKAHLPAGATNPTVLGFDGHWLYAQAAAGSGSMTCSPGIPTSCQLPAVSTLTVASDDGGRTWQEMQLPPNHDASYAFVGVAPSGGLIYDDGSQLWHANGAGHFVRMTEATKTQYLLGLGPAMVAIRVADDGTITLATSTDGAHWANATIR